MIILESVIGSVMHGLNHPNSDVDKRSVAVSPLIEMLDPFTPQKIRTHQQGKNDDVVYELQTFLQLLSKGSPSVIDVVYSPLASPMNLIGQELWSKKHLFIDKDSAVRAMRGYAFHMIENAEKGIRPLKSLRSAVLTAEVVYTCLLDNNYDPLTSDTRRDIIDICREEEPLALARMRDGLLFPLIGLIDRCSYTNYFNKTHVKEFCYASYTKGLGMNA